jgi:serine/threonine protein kinase
VSQDLVEAAKYYKLSADQGDPFGQEYYGRCLEDGKGVAQDMTQAIKYYRLAADQGSREGGKGYNGLKMSVENLEEVKELESGRFGVVRLMKHNRRKEEFVMKSLPGDFGNDQLQRELSILCSLNHKCIVKIAASILPDETSRELRIVTEFIGNGSLEDVLLNVEKGQIPIFWKRENITKMIVGVVLGMRYLHSQDIFHGDLKPGNLLIDEDNLIRISDFWISRIEECGARPVGIGSRSYVSPEILNFEFSTKKSDVFAFGMLLYDMVTGKTAFPRDLGPMRFVGMQVKGYRPLIPDSVSLDVGKLIEGCWNEEPEKRPTFDEVYERMRNIRFKFFDDMEVDAGAIEDFIREIEGET